jgi:hypothetical protein
MELHILLTLTSFLTSSMSRQWNTERWVYDSSLKYVLVMMNFAKALPRQEAIKTTG